MRYFVMVLMMILLPLRSWAGDVMATQMASAAVNSSFATQKIATNIDKTSATSELSLFKSSDRHAAAAHAMPDCASHAPDQAPDTTASHAACDTCQACQACHTVALACNTAVVSRVFASPRTPLALAAHFTSATAALGQKPPIS